ncbi:MAG: hypothetical protein CSA52_04280 [Gammaproteobacteria bacterium]|nr:MAG: hypothetical protein CSB48_06660 [Pseudomonadota bacterium]PIE37890.1 MAG: hypothetical protein CSA52_04280 [Gammaproteobacteria bacterium]
MPHHLITKLLTRIEAKKITIFIALLTSLFSISFLYYGISLSRSIRQSETLWQNHIREETRENLLFNKIEQELGYGGFIHHYKNLILRQDVRLIPRIEDNLNNLKQYLHAYQNHLEKGSEPYHAITDIARVIGTYENKLKQARLLINSSEHSPTQIDKKMLVDDQEALAAFKLLNDHVLLEQRKKEQEAGEAMKSNLVQFNLGWFFVALFFIYAAIIVLCFFGLNRLILSLKVSRELQESLFGSFPDSVLVVNTEGTIVKANSLASQITGYSIDQLVGLKVESLFPQNIRFDHPAFTNSTFGNRESRLYGKQEHLSILAKNEEEIPVDIAIDYANPITGKVAILNIRDIREEKRVRDKLLERESMLNQAQAISKVGCWKWELESDQLLLSQEAKRIYQFGMDEEHFTPERLIQKIPPQEKEIVANAINESVLLEKPYHVLHHLKSGSGDQTIVEQFGEVTKNENGKVVAMLGVVRDVTEQKYNEYMLQLANNVFNHSAEAIMVTDTERRILRVNRAFETITYYNQSEVAGKNPDRFMRSDKYTDDFYNNVSAVLEATDLWTGELWDKRKNGEVFPSRHTVSAVRDKDGEVIQYIDLFSDITEKKKQEEYIYKLAHYDQLTQLPNRALFLDRLRQSIIRARRKNNLVGLMFIDLDRFKYVNDTLGHEAGDELLAVISGRLLSVVREQDTVSRLGGDEFTVILEDISDSHNSQLVANKIIKQVCKPVTIDGNEVTVGASIGISTYPEHGEQEDVLIKCADTAMYHAKESGRNQSKIYDLSMSEVTSEKFHMERLLRKAIDNEEFDLYFQPQINITEGVVSGCEALVRWNHPEHGVIGPVQFIPLAEETGLIIPLGEWVLKNALTRAAGWKKQGLEFLSVSVNVSSRQLSTPNFARQVRQLIKSTRVDTRQLELEITESAVMENPGLVITELNQIREFGVSISLDDFGTGYSSLSYLRKLPVSKVKIDRSFVRDINLDRDDEEIVKAIIAMSKTLGLEVIAEGVETKDHIDFILQTDCEQVQGYYYSQPLPEEKFLQFVRGFNQIGKDS